MNQMATENTLLRSILKLIKQKSKSCRENIRCKVEKVNTMIVKGKTSVWKYEGKRPD